MSAVPTSSSPDRLRARATAAPLVPARLRRVATWYVGLAAALVAVLAAVVWHGESTALDSWLLHTSTGPLSARAGQLLLDLSSPRIDVVLLAIVAAAAVVARRWDLVVVAVLGPSLTVGLIEVVLKPLVARRLAPDPLRPLLSGSLPNAFPSGHEAGVVSAVVVVVLAMRLVPVRRGVRMAVQALLVLWAVLAGVGLVRVYWHYATDVVGGIAVSTAVCVSLAMALDRFGHRLRGRADSADSGGSAGGDGVSSPGARSPSSTSRAA